MITKTKLLYLASFAGGALIGSAVTWQILKKKYEKLAQEEIDSVIEKFSSMYGENENRDEDDSTDKTDDDEPDEEDTEYDDEYGHDPDDVYDGVETGDPDVVKYNELVGLYSGEDRNILRRNAIKNQRPYSITVDDFGELEGYESVTLYYYADEILAFEDGNPIGNIDDVVGLDAIDELMNDKYGADTVFVRNDRLKTDYEIIPSAQYHNDINWDD